MGSQRLNRVANETPPPSPPRSGAGQGRIRIFLIDDHVILREGLRALLQLEPQFEVVGEALSVPEAMRVVETSRPDLVITDIALPGDSGLSIIPLLKERLPNAVVIVLTAHCTDEYVHAALKVGASGYILKDATREELLEGIRSALDGRQYLSAAVTRHVISGYLDKREPSRPKVPVTLREREVLKLIALGHSTKHIAMRLNLSVKTVEKHRSNLMRKLDLQNSAAVTLYAVRQKLVPIDLVGAAPELVGPRPKPVTA
jgi:DNA-binding NarL/FixJ family response regulator